MRKFNFLVGAASGLIGGLLLSNKQLRKKLSEAEDPGEAAKILGKEVQRSGKQVMKEAKHWIESEEVQDRWGLMKKYMKKKMDEAKEGASIVANDAKKKVKKELPILAHKAKKQAHSTYKSARKSIEEKLK